MSRHFLVALAVCLSATSCQSQGSTTQPRLADFHGLAADDVAEIIVRLNDGVPPVSADLQTEHPSVAHQRALLLSRCHLYNVRPGIDPQTALDELRSDPRVEYAEPNGRIQIQAALQLPALDKLQVGDGVGGRIDVERARTLAMAAVEASSSDRLDRVVDGIVQAQQLGAKAIHLTSPATPRSATMQRAIAQAAAAGVRVVQAATGAAAT